MPRDSNANPPPPQITHENQPTENMLTNPNAPTAVTPAILATMDAGIASMTEGCRQVPRADAELLRRAAKMGDKSETFAREAIELAKNNAHLCPKSLDLEQAEQAIATRDELRIRYLRARFLAETLEVAMQVCGVDAFDAARTAYKSMKMNCRDAALLQLLEHVGRNFRSRRRKVDEAPPESDESVNDAGSAAPVTSDNHSRDSVLVEGRLSSKPLAINRSEPPGGPATAREHDAPLHLVVPPDAHSAHAAGATRGGSQRDGTMAAYRLPKTALPGRSRCVLLRSVWGPRYADVLSPDEVHEGRTPPTMR